jgi:hypothetical protein
LFLLLTFQVFLLFLALFLILTCLFFLELFLTLFLLLPLMLFLLLLLTLTLELKCVLVLLLPVRSFDVLRSECRPVYMQVAKVLKIFLVVRKEFLIEEQLSCRVLLVGFKQVIDDLVQLLEVLQILVS